MTSAAAYKAHSTRRLQRAAELGVELRDESPLDTNDIDDVGFSVCPECQQISGTTHVCTSGIRTAREAALDAMRPELRRWGWAWVSFLLGEGPRPVIPRGMADDCRNLELRIAEVGLVDPAGIVFGVDNLRLKRKGPRRHTRGGEMPETLRRHLADQRNHRSGRMY